MGGENGKGDEEYSGKTMGMARVGRRWYGEGVKVV